MPVCVEYPDDWIDDDDWEDWYWQYLDFGDLYDWMYGDDWSDLGGWEELIEQYFEDLLSYASDEFWLQLFRHLSRQPQAINPGLNWSGSTAEQRFSQLRIDSPTFDGLVTPFSTGGVNLTLYNLPSTQFYTMAGANPAGAETTWGNTWFDVYAFGSGQVTGADAHVNINAAIDDGSGNTVTLTGVGFALAMAHEIMHARFTLALPLADHYFLPSAGPKQPQDYQHDAMTVSDRLVIETVVREYVTANGITLQITSPPAGASYPANFDYVEMLSWNGLLKTHAGMDYIMAYAQTVWGVTFTVADKNAPTAAEIANLNTYGQAIREAIAGLATQ